MANKTLISIRAKAHFFIHLLAKLFA